MEFPLSEIDLIRVTVVERPHPYERSAPIRSLAEEAGVVVEFICIMRRLGETVARVSGRIKEIEKRGESVGEQDTKAILIDPILSALGWRLDELDEVRREYRRKPQDNPVDYALFALRKPRLFIEAKKLWVPPSTNVSAPAGLRVCVGGRCGLVRGHRR